MDTTSELIQKLKRAEQALLNINNISDHPNGWEWSEIESARTIARKYFDKKDMSEGIKYDAGKPRIGFLLRSFPNALMALARQNDFGAKKYDEFNWKKVSVERYEDAFGRHSLKSLSDKTAIDESGEYHLASVIWNACALYELLYGEKNSLQNNDINV